MERRGGAAVAPRRESEKSGERETAVSDAASPWKATAVSVRLQ